MKKTPLQTVRERFGDKKSLVKQLESLFSKDDVFLDRLNEEKGLESVSNSHLLKLFDVGTKVKEQFGSRKKLIGTIMDTLKRSKDEGLKTRLEGFNLPRLWDYYNSSLKKAAKGPNKPRAKKKSGKKSKSRRKRSA